MEILRLEKSTSKMNYATHGFHRFFGKLPSEVYKYILGKESSFVELMCGSGTGLVEGLLMGKRAIGVDSNLLAVLLSKVKTTPVDVVHLSQKLNEITLKFHQYRLPHQEQESIDAFFNERNTIFEFSENDYAMQILTQAQERIANFHHWFSERCALELALLRSIIEETCFGDDKDFFLVVLSSIIRRVSNASPRTGKLFHIGHDNNISVLSAFKKKAKYNIMGMKEFIHLLPKEPQCQILREDARNTSIPSDSQSLVICHPPYFALYRYSAIFRLEFGWLGFDRNVSRVCEIEEGFKATNIEKYKDYLIDMTQVIREAYRLLHKGGRFCLIVGDSSLRSNELPVVSDLKSIAIKMGFHVVREIRRIIKGSQAQYHPSTKSKMMRGTDSLIFFEKK